MDTQFNAITGLNGSGKSNILDAICFVLGLSTLKDIRAEKAQELIYKNGTAGVTKASVTLVWDNTDKNRSHVDYTDFDEITVERRIDISKGSKNYINSKSVTMQGIKDFFKGVQLNVDNPHFLIM